MDGGTNVYAKNTARNGAPLTLDNLVNGKFTLDQVIYFYRRGVIDRKVFDAYLHGWQTSAIRFTQQCRCIECNAAWKDMD